MNLILDAKMIQEIIPHRYPFLMIDRVDNLEIGKSAVGYKNVTINENFFQGHFPKEPVMPGVLIVEALAQVGAVVLLSEEKFKGNTVYFAGINKVKFKRKVIPGDILKLEIQVSKLKGRIGLVKGVATVRDQKVVEGEFTFAVKATKEGETHV